MPGAALSPGSPGKSAPPDREPPERLSVLDPLPRGFVEALTRAGIRLRVSHVQPDGMTPIYVAAPIAAVRRFVPAGAEIEGISVRFPDEWVIAFCGSERA